MTKIGLDLNGKPGDPGSVEKGVLPPVLLQTQPVNKTQKSSFGSKLTIGILLLTSLGLLIAVIVLEHRVKSLENHHRHHHHGNHGGSSHGHNGGNSNGNHGGNSNGNHGGNSRPQGGGSYNLLKAGEDHPYGVPQDRVEDDSSHGVPKARAAAFEPMQPDIPEPVYRKYFTKPGLRQEVTNFTFDDMFSGEFAYRTPFAQFVGETNDVYYFNSDLDLVLRNLDTGTEETLLDAAEVIAYGVSFVFLSTDERYILLPYDGIDEVQDGFGTYRFRVYDRQAEPGAEVFDFPNDEVAAGQHLVYAGWVGDSNALAYIFDNDVYYQADPYSPPTRLTTSGENEGVRNGLSFWNYAGVLWDMPAYWFSADQQYLVYGHFDSSGIPLSEHPVYGDSDQMYPYIFRQVYLKSGDAERFSTAELRVLDLSGEEPAEVLTFDPPEEFRNQDHYFFGVEWRDASHVILAWCNRQQTEYVVEVCSVPDGLCQRNRDEAVENGWIRGPYQAFDRLIHNGEDYLAIISATVDDVVGRYQQVAVVSAPTNADGEVTLLTFDTNDAFAIAGFSEERNLVYYWATADGNQLTMHLYRVGTPDADPEERPAVCLTCPGNNPVPQDCQYVSTVFSYSTDYYQLSCLGPDVPSFHLIWTYQDNYYTIEDNADLVAKIQNKTMPTKEYVMLDIGGGYQGWAEVTLPPNMVVDGSVQYPVLFYPYAGPHGTTQGNYAFKSLSSANNGGWDTYLASSEGVITVRLNGRGSGSRGDRFIYTLFRALGTNEIDDQVFGAESMIANFPYVDPDKFAVWGWSYGGFTTSHVIGHPTDIFTCGLAVAPVTNFRYYYAGYTERYMGLDTPEDNQAGYNATDAMRKVENFRGKNYFIAHGTLDDNVHPQNAFQMVRALDEAQILHDANFYVDENHSIQDRDQYRHLFLSMNNFLLNRCWARGQ